MLERHRSTQAASDDAIERRRPIPSHNLLIFKRSKRSKRETGGEGGIRTPGTGFGPYNGLAKHFRQSGDVPENKTETLQPLIFLVFTSLS